MLDLSHAESFYKWGHEQPHLPVLEYCLSKLKFDGSILEFGTWTGISTNFIAKKIYPKIIHTFDSFEGLQEDWNGLEKGYFKTDLSKLHFEPNVMINKGYFIDTISVFLDYNTSRISFINIDCDLYQSTKDVLFGLNDYIYPGTIIYFDEIYNYPSWNTEGEYKALMEWGGKFLRSVRAIAYNDDRGVAVEVVE